MIDRCIRWMADPFGSERRRRARLMAQPFPPEWQRTLDALPFYRALPEADAQRLRGLILLFRAEKHFEGCGGLELDDGIMVTIAAHAVLLVLRRDDALYPSLRSILVYPHAYVAKYLASDGPRRIQRDEAVMLGTSWTSGTVILAWDAVEKGYRHPRDGHNVALHEFAHQLDQENGPVDGAPGLGRGRPAAARRVAYGEWQRIMATEYEALCAAVDAGQRTLLDPYGATAPAEFFAVVTETFFERPLKLRDRHPELYAQLQRYYDQDPASWNW